MPGKKRRIHPRLIERLQREPYRFEFFQAVRLLLAHLRHNSVDKEQDLLGQVIAFRNSVSLSFPASEIEAMRFEWEDENGRASDGEMAFTRAAGDGQLPIRRVEITPAFFGLTGPLGVLPRHYTQHVAEREIYHRDQATRAFLDIFTTRAVALFYKSWLKYRLHLQYESDRRNRFLPLVLSLSGLGLAGTRDRLAEAGQGVADESLAYYVSALRERPQSIHWFARVAADYLQVDCRAESFVGQWFDLPVRECSRLGGANAELGITALCGSRIWDRQSKVRIVLGPMRRQRFNELLPGTSAARSLARLFRLMVGPTFDCEVRLVLDRRDVLPARTGGEEGSTRLGWNGWLHSGAASLDASDTAYLLDAANAE